MTWDLTPKITNFKYIHALQNSTVNFTQIVRWLAPEQMQTNIKNLNQQVAATLTQQRLKKEKKEVYIPYTIQCEIFR